MSDAALEKLKGRLRALAAKTVENGCTEDEALAAAGKLAELLDAHELTLDALSAPAGACATHMIATGRRRDHAVALCLNAIGDFAGCRIWKTVQPDGTIGYAVFGLPSDIELAVYIHDILHVAIDTEVARFKWHAKRRRALGGGPPPSAASFATGMAASLSERLRELGAGRTQERQARGGRDLVPMKEKLVEEEFAKLGLSLTHRSLRRMVSRDAYDAGREAGARIEIRKGLK